MDNAPAYPEYAVWKSENRNFFVVYLPTNITAITQPLDQGITEFMKRFV